MSDAASGPLTGIEYLDLYIEMLRHQRDHCDPLLLRSISGRREQPWDHCIECLKAGDDGGYEHHGLKRRYSWAVPSERALEAIDKHSPGGVVEIGAGGGYWAMLLQQRGVDVVAYDPAPPPEESNWHCGRAWTAVHVGDHTSVVRHPDRTLLLCWPSYSEPWPAQALELYQGDTVIYIGESGGGCTADDRFHALLGEELYCWHGDDDDGNRSPCPVDCPSKTPPLFERLDEVPVPQWAGLHDYLTVYRRIAGGSRVTPVADQIAGRSNGAR